MELLTDGREERRITLIRDTTLVYPELWMEVWIQGENDLEDSRFAEMFVKARCTKAKSPETADLVVFGGGSDVNPILYDEEAHYTTHFDARRDERDILLYETCYNLGIPMMGVCRGAQFLWVMNGGKLFQDVDKHTGDHSMYDLMKKRMVKRVSSVHHQACIANDKVGQTLADALLSTIRWKNKTDKEEGRRRGDVEAYFIRETCCFGVQGHPEYRGYHEFMQWTFEYINDLIVCNPDLELRNNNRRMKQELLDERNAKAKELMKEAN